MVGTSTPNSSAMRRWSEPEALGLVEHLDVHGVIGGAVEDELAFLGGLGRSQLFSRRSLEADAVRKILDREAEGQEPGILDFEAEERVKLPSSAGPG